MSWLKYVSLAVAIGSVAVAMWLFESDNQHGPSSSLQLSGSPGETMKAQTFQYIETVGGKSVYRLSGQEIHDEHARIGPLRTSALKIVLIQQPQVELLQEGLGKGWVLTANEGRIIASRRKLTLSGNVRGRHHDGSILFANKAVVDVEQGSIQLRDGYKLKTPQRNEKGIQTTL